MAMEYNNGDNKMIWITLIGKQVHIHTHVRTCMYVHVCTYNYIHMTHHLYVTGCTNVHVYSASLHGYPNLELLELASLCMRSYVINFKMAALYAHNVVVHINFMAYSLWSKTEATLHYQTSVTKDTL